LLGIGTGNVVDLPVAIVVLSIAGFRDGDGGIARAKPLLPAESLSAADPVFGGDLASGAESQGRGFL